MVDDKKEGSHQPIKTAPPPSSSPALHQELTPIPPHHHLTPACFTPRRALPDPFASSQIHRALPSIAKDEDHSAGVGDGVPGGGDAAAAAVELGARPGGAAVPHAQRLLLPAQGRGGQGPVGSRRELLRRRPDAARPGGGARPLLSDGRAAGARRGRPRRDRLQRRRGAVPGGGRARRRRRRLWGLRAHHGAQAPHPRRRVHRRHLRLPAPRAPGDPLQMRWRGDRRGHAAPRRRRLLRPALHQLVGGPLPRRPDRRHALHRPVPPPRSRPPVPNLPAHRVPAGARHALRAAAAGAPHGETRNSPHRRGHLQAHPPRPRPPPLAPPRGHAAVQHVRGAGGARVAVRVPGAPATGRPAHQAVLRHGRAAAAAAAAARGVLRQRDLHGDADGGGTDGDGRGGGGGRRDPGGAGPDGRRVLQVGAGLPGAAAGLVGAGPGCAHVPVPQPGAHQLGAPAHPRRRLRVGPARVHGARRHRVRGARLRAPQRQPRRQPLRGHRAAGRAHGEVPEAHLRLLIHLPDDASHQQKH